MDFFRNRCTLPSTRPLHSTFQSSIYSVLAFTCLHVLLFSMGTAPGLPTPSPSLETDLVLSRAPLQPFKRHIDHL